MNKKIYKNKKTKHVTNFLKFCGCHLLEKYKKSGHFELVCWLTVLIYGLSFILLVVLSIYPGYIFTQVPSVLERQQMLLSSVTEGELTLVESNLETNPQDFYLPLLNNEYAPQLRIKNIDGKNYIPYRTWVSGSNYEVEWKSKEGSQKIVIPANDLEISIYENKGQGYSFLAAATPQYQYAESVELFNEQTGEKEPSNVKELLEEEIQEKQKNEIPQEEIEKGAAPSGEPEKGQPPEEEVNEPNPEEGELLTPLEKEIKSEENPSEIENISEITNEELPENNADVSEKSLEKTLPQPTGQEEISPEIPVESSPELQVSYFSMAVETIKQGARFLISSLVSTVGDILDLEKPEEEALVAPPLEKEKLVINWVDYTADINSIILSEQNFDNYNQITVSYNLYDQKLNRTKASIVVKVGFDGDRYINETIYQIDSNEYINRMYWKVNFEKEGLINEDVIDLEETKNEYKGFLFLDSDNDGLPDDEESLWETDPLKKDSDLDGIIDSTEVEKRKNPINNSILNYLEQDKNNQPDLTIQSTSESGGESAETEGGISGNPSPEEMNLFPEIVPGTPPLEPEPMSEPEPVSESGSASEPGAVPESVPVSEPEAVPDLESISEPEPALESPSSKEGLQSLVELEKYYEIEIEPLKTAEKIRGQEFDGIFLNWQEKGLKTKVSQSRSEKSNNVLFYQNVLNNLFETAASINLSSPEKQILVVSKEKFELIFNADRGGIIDSWYDLENDPDKKNQLADSISGFFNFSSISNEQLEQISASTFTTYSILENTSDRIILQFRGNLGLIGHDYLLTYTIGKNGIIYIKLDLINDFETEIVRTNQLVSLNIANPVSHDADGDKIRSNNDLISPEQNKWIRWTGDGVNFKDISIVHHKKGFSYNKFYQLVNQVGFYSDIAEKFSGQSEKTYIFALQIKPDTQIMGTDAAMVDLFNQDISRRSDFDLFSLKKFIPLQEFKASAITTEEGPGHIITSLPGPTPNNLGDNSIKNENDKYFADNNNYYVGFLNGKKLDLRAKAVSVSGPRNYRLRHYLDLGPINRQIEPLFVNGQIIYNEIYPGIDIAYQVEQDMIKEFIILKNKEALTDFKFYYLLDDKSQLIKLPDGTIALFDLETNQEILAVDLPEVTDSNGRIINAELILAETDYNNKKYQNITIKFGDLENVDYPVIIDPTYTVKTNIGLTGGTQYNNSRKLARASNGDLHCVYSRADGSYTQIYHAKSTDQGQNWTEDKISSDSESTNKNQYTPSLAVDSGDNLHVVWYGYTATYSSKYNIRYSKFNGSSWSTPAFFITTGNTYDQYNPAIAIDSNNYLHVVWHGYSSTAATVANVRYSKYTSSWLSPVNIITETVSGRDQTDAALAVDSSNYIHVVWCGKSSSYSAYNIRYSEYTTSWSSPSFVTTVSSYDQINPSIAIDSLDYLHVVWKGKSLAYSGVYNIRYSKYTTSWSSPIDITTGNTYGEENPSISADSNNYIYVIWEGGSATYGMYNIQYSKYTSSWSSPAFITTNSSYAQNHPTVLWSNYPVVNSTKTNITTAGYTLIWMGYNGSSYDVYFHASSDLDWPSMYPPTAGTVTINPSPINLSEGTSYSVTCSSTITDNDGYADISTSSYATFYRTSQGDPGEAGSLDNNDKYRDNSAALSNCTGNTCDGQWSLDVWYYADPTDAGSIYASDTWTCKVVPKDSSGAGTPASSTVEMNTLTALNVYATINYGTFALGENSSSCGACDGIKYTAVTNTGNEGIDVSISGQNATCTTGSIAVGNQEYSSSTFTYGSGTDLTDSLVELDLDIPQRTNGETSSNVYWGLGVPAQGAEGGCTGENTITVVSDPNLD